MSTRRKRKEAEEETPPRKAMRDDLDDEKKVEDKPAAAAPASGDAFVDPKKQEWVQVDELFWALNPDGVGCPPKAKIAGFDLDDTLVACKSGAKFPNGRKDWKWLHPCVPEVLKKHYDMGFKIVIFTNQAGVEKKHAKVGDLTGKITDLCGILGFPMQALMACATDHWRKPNPTMWKYFTKHMNNGVEVDMKESLFVGDAAGRPKNWAAGRKKDFSCSDRKFAVNTGLTFKTPEEFFLGEKPCLKFDWDGEDPQKIMNEFKGKTAFVGSSITKPTQEIVLSVGCPASGKSTFSKRHFEPAGYVIVNRDTLKTPAKCQKAAEAALREGKSVVIDNTNPDPSARAPYITMAKKAKVPVRCFVFTTPRAVAEHLNIVREKMTEGKVRRIPDVGFNVFGKNFTQPSVKEGLAEVCTVNFVPTFDSKEDEERFLERT